MNDLTKPLCIYHGNCADGFTAAWLYNIWYWQEGLDNPGKLPDDWCVDHHAAIYGKPPPDVSGRKVVILDFSYPPEVLQVICDEAYSVLMIDHHISNIRALKDFKHPRLETVLDDSRCGAYLAAQYMWPDREPSEMVKLVDDRDRWVFHYPDTRPFHASLFSRPYKIGEWNSASRNIKGEVADGIAIDRKHLKDIHELLDLCMQWEDLDGQRVPCVNLPYTLASDACAIMLERYPNVPFVAAWYLRGDEAIVFSLRSRDDQFDVSVLAAKYGGGGHATAAGMAVRVWPDAVPKSDDLPV
jgi:hypothetical protein